MPVLKMEMVEADISTTPVKPLPRKSDSDMPLIETVCWTVYVVTIVVTSSTFSMPHCSSVQPVSMHASVSSFQTASPSYVHSTAVGSS